MAKLPPLTNVKTSTGNFNFNIDPGKISMISRMPEAEVLTTTNIKLPAFVGASNSAGGPILGAIATHIWGLFPGPMPITLSPDQVLDTFKIRDKFVALTTPDGTPTWIKAAAVSWITKKYPGENADPNKNCYLGVAGSTSRVAVKDDVGTVQASIDAIRANTDA